MNDTDLHSINPTRQNEKCYQKKKKNRRKQFKDNNTVKKKKHSYCELERAN